MKMLRLLASVLLAFLICTDTNHAQIVDPEICPQGASPPIVDPNWRNIPQRFEIVTELVAGNSVMELSQAFTTNRDAVMLSTSNGPLQLYWNFLTNEQFEVLNIVIAQQVLPICLRQVVSTGSETSVLQPNTLFLKPSVLLGYNERNQQNSQWGISYDGEQDLRGIPVSRFKSCFYVNDIRASVAVTYYVSNVTRFQAYLPSNTSIILQLDVKVKNQLGKRESYIFNVIRYSPNPRRREENQALETPTGVYCQNRTPTLPVPGNIPERVSTNTEVLFPNFNSSLISTHSLYDTRYQFSRFDAWFPDRDGQTDWSHVTEMHDFAVGLSYIYDHNDHHCTVRNISIRANDAVPSDSGVNLIEMGTPEHFFLLDDMEYHYTGEKRCRDRVWCHVWVGEKLLSNNITDHREWYWASNMNDVPIEPWIPMKMITKQILAGVQIFQAEINMFNFRRNPLTIFEIDYTLADCYRALGPSENYNLAVLTFKIVNDKNYPLLKNLNSLRLTIWESLIFALFVRPTRISHLIVDQDENDIVVTFTLLDAPPRTGPVENPLEETPLDTLLDRFTSLIDSKGLVFRTRVDTKTVILRARPNSLNIGHRSKTTIVKSSGPRITGLWLGFIAIGLVVGGLVGFLTFAKYARS